MIDEGPGGFCCGSIGCVSVWQVCGRSSSALIRGFGSVHALASGVVHASATAVRSSARTSGGTQADVSSDFGTTVACILCHPLAGLNGWPIQLSPVIRHVLTITSASPMRAICMLYGFQARPIARPIARPANNCQVGVGFIGRGFKWVAEVHLRFALVLGV